MTKYFSKKSKTLSFRLYQIFSRCKYLSTCQPHFKSLYFYIMPKQKCKYFGILKELYLVDLVLFCYLFFWRLLRVCFTDCIDNVIANELEQYHEHFTIFNFFYICVSILQRKLLAIYLHNDESVLSNVFCSQMMCADSIVSYLSQNFITWAWDVTKEANKAR